MVGGEREREVLSWFTTKVKRLSRNIHIRKQNRKLRKVNNLITNIAEKLKKESTVNLLLLVHPVSVKCMVHLL